MSINPYQPPETNAVLEPQRFAWPHGTVAFVATFVAMAILVGICCLEFHYDFGLGDLEGIYSIFYVVAMGILCGCHSIRAAFGGFLGGWLGTVASLLPVLIIGEVDVLSVSVMPISVLIMYAMFFIPSCFVGLWMSGRWFDGQDRRAREAIRRLRPMSNDVSFLDEDTKTDDA